MVRVRIGRIRPGWFGIAWERKPIAAAAIGLALVALGVAACGGSGRSTTSPSSCNGSAALCSRPLNEVIFPGTHNSFAAATEPGWHFANQTYSIRRQLDDGIRALTLDIHFGVYDPATGRVRTDLAAEGSDRNKVAKQLSPAALRVADRVAGGVGLGTLKGTSKPYLCHTLCELGAEPLDQELRVIATFLHRHPDQVLIVIVEDYVPSSTIEQSFTDAGLKPFAATLRTGERLPTLGHLIRSGQRLLLFAEAKGGTPAWYMPAFTFIQDTPLGAIHPGQLSCARYRGNEHSPLLLLNHWIPPFPPSPTINAGIGRASFLRARIARCERARDVRGAIVAVDFYERTAVVKIAQQLNNTGG